MTTMTMKPAHLLHDGAISGSAAGLLSIVALALVGRHEHIGAVAPLNAPSHWLFGRRALRQDDASLRYTATGLVTHQLSALFWGVVQAAWSARREPRRHAVGAAVGDALLVTAGAAVVDLVVVPERLTPGFERRLSKPGLALVYAAFGTGLAAGAAWCAARRR